MRPLLLLVLLLAFASLINAQTLIQGSESAPELKMVGAGWEWHNVPTGPPPSGGVSMSVSQALAAGTPAALNATSNGRVVVPGSGTAGFPGRKPDPINCKATLLFENTGAKTIRAIYADYIFLDPENRSELLRYEFRAETKISPGKSKKISQEIYQKVGRNRKFYTPAKPTSELLKRAGSGLFKVIVTRVEYTDGSSWQRP